MPPFLSKKDTIIWIICWVNLHKIRQPAFWPNVFYFTDVPLTCRLMQHTFRIATVYMRELACTSRACKYWQPQRRYRHDERRIRHHGSHNKNAKDLRFSFYWTSIYPQNGQRALQPLTRRKHHVIVKGNQPLKYEQYWSKTTSSGDLRLAWIYPPQCTAGPSSSSSYCICYKYCLKRYPRSNEFYWDATVVLLSRGLSHSHHSWYQVSPVWLQFFIACVLYYCALRKY